MRVILSAFSFLFILTVVKGQNVDTTIYENYALKTDTIKRLALPPRFLFDAVPEFPGGEKGYTKFLKNSIHYPSGAKEKDKHGRVILSVVVEKNGKITNAKIIRGISDDLNKEAIRVIESSPKWSPAIFKGNPVRARYIVVIGFDERT